jgi:hypothetical protein
MEGLGIKDQGSGDDVPAEAGTHTETAVRRVHAGLAAIETKSPLTMRSAK